MKHLRRASSVDKRDFKLASQLVEILLIEGLPDKALTVLATVPSSPDLDPELDRKFRCAAARATLELGDAESAASTIILVLQRYNFSDVCQSEVLLFIEQIRGLENFDKMLKQLVELMPVDRHYFSGKIYFQLGEYHNAILHLKDLPKDIGSSTRDTNILASCYVGQGNFSEAEPLYKDIVANKPDHPVAILGLALCQYSRDPELGVNTCCDLLQNHPLYLPAVLQRANWAYANEEYSIAEEYFRRAIELSPSSYKANFMLGKAMLGLDQAEDAAHYLELAYCLNDDFTDARVQLAKLFSEEQPTKSLSIIEDTLIVEKHRHDANLLFQKAKYLNILEDLEGALQALRSALDFEENSAPMYNGYAVLLREKGRLDEAFEAINRAEHLDPEWQPVLLNKAILLCDLGQREQGLNLFNNILDKCPDELDTQWHRASYFLADKQFNLGWLDYESRWHREGIERRDFGAEVWSPESCGEKVLVYREQGLGDEIMFSSCVPDLVSIVDQIVLECHPKLEKLFRRSFPRVAVIANSHLDVPAGFINEHNIDRQIACGSLPGHFRNSLESFAGGKAYLSPDPIMVEQWTKKIRQYEGKRLIGVSWRGGAYSTRMGIRSIPLSDLEPLFYLQDTVFFSLQYGDAAAADLAYIESIFGVEILHYQEVIDDYDKTAALLSCLDVVVSVQTSLVHLCGALGVPVLCMLPNLPEWRYGYEGDSMPWYGSVRLIRQKSIGNWSGVVAKVCKLIDEKY